MEYTATFTPANILGRDFCYEDAFRRYQGEMGRRASRLADIIGRTQIVSEEKLPEGSEMAKLFMVGGFTAKGENYFVGRYFSNIKYERAGESDSLWAARYEIVAGSDDQNFVEEIIRGLETGTPDVIKAGVARNIFLRRSSFLGTKEPLWVMYNLPTIQRELEGDLPDAPGMEYAPA